MAEAKNAATELKPCKKIRCIANVGGKCAVDSCQGEITSTGRRSADVDNAAKFYKVAKEAFLYYFSENYIDDDKEE